MNAFELPKGNGHRDRSDIWTKLPAPLQGIVVGPTALLLVAGATLIGVGVSRWMPHESVALSYLMVVMLAALAFGMTTGVTAALLSFLAYNFFFIAPIYTFTIGDPQEIFSLGAFLFVALLTGSLAGRLREVADAARRRAASLQTLNDFAANLSGSRDKASILAALADQAAATVGGDAVVLMLQSGALNLSAATPAAPVLQSMDWQSAQRAYRSGGMISAAAVNSPGPQYEFHPIVSAEGVLGVVGLVYANRHRDEHDAILNTIIRHAAIAIDRTRLEAETAAARDETERERLRSALLSSISHDLRTPLASILGAATSLRDLGEAMTPEMRSDLLIAIEEETEQLSRFVSNLLDMTRLEASDIDLKRDWIDLTDAAQVAVAHAKRRFPGINIHLAVASPLAAIRGDATLIEHVVANLIDNSVKFSTPGAPIDIACAQSGANVSLSVTDRGCGIAPDAVGHVFDAFYRAAPGHVQGTGLGLAIAKRIVEGMGGTIAAHSPVVDGRGTRITATFPVPAASPVVQFEDEKAS